MLSESVLQRVRAAMDAKPEQPASQTQPAHQNQAASQTQAANHTQVANQKQPASQTQTASQNQAASSERPASLPRRAAGANNGPRPPAEAAWAPLSASLFGRTRDADYDTAPIPVISGSAGSETESPPADETSAELDRAARAQRAQALRAAKALRAARAERAAIAQRAKANLAEAERAAKADPTNAERAAEAERAKANLAEAERAVEAEHAAEAPADHRPVAVIRAPEERRPTQQADGRKALTRRTYRLAIAAVLVVVFALGALALALFRHATTTAPHDGLRAGPNALKIEAATRNLAAAWIFDQVSGAAKVSCDPAMCQALKAHKIPPGRLLELGTGAADPLGSDVIVATAAVRSEFGRRLGSVYAPTVLASFGSGSLRITVREIAPDGAAAYRAALAKDLLDRKASGAQLLQSPLIVASAEARKQLAAGQVDLRLLYTIADMAAQPIHAQHPVDIVAFGDSGPGASAGMPLRSADLTETAGGARAGSSAGVRSMLAHLRAQGGPPYPYGRATIVRLAGGRTVLRIEFAAPSPLGLGNAKTP